VETEMTGDSDIGTWTMVIYKPWFSSVKKSGTTIMQVNATFT